jgi:hypothetical protein
MEDDSNEDTKNEKQMRMELKYCERCGGLWVRECGAAVVYCPSCRPKVNELPVPKKRSGRISLPVGRRSLLERFRNDAGDEGNDVEAAGGAA